MWWLISWQTPDESLEYYVEYIYSILSQMQNKQTSFNGVNAYLFFGQIYV